MSKVSVIIPSYNSKKFIIRCLNALENQVFCDFEVVIVDDFSSDDSVKIINEYKASSSLDIVLVVNEENYGPGKSRNIGIAKSKGEYISFCDSDDWYDSDYLQKMIERIDDEHVDVVICGYKQVFDSKETINYHFANYQRDLDKRRLLTLDVDALWRIMIKREIAISNPIPEIWNAEDMAIIPVWLLEAQGYAVVKDCIYNYSCTAGSLSTKISDRAIKSSQESYKYITQRLLPDYRNEAEYLIIRNYLYGAILGLYKCSSDNKYAKELIEEFEELYPTWEKNKYICELPIYKRFFIFAVKHKLYIVMKMFSKLHAFLR